MTARPLVIGGRSAIGRALAARLEAAGHQPTATDRSTLDLADAASIERFAFPAGVDSLVVLAAMTSIAACEADPALAARTNHLNPARLLQRASEAGIPSLVVSTNLVFNGSTPHAALDDPTSPQTVYGQTKAALEADARAAGGAVLRLTKVIPPDDSRLLGWQRALAADETVTAFDDLHIAPVTLSHVVDALVQWTARPEPMTRHLSGEADVSWYTLARALARAHHLDADRVRPASAAAAGIPPAQRPRYTSLNAPAPQALDAVLRSLDLPPVHRRR